MSDSIGTVATFARERRHFRVGALTFPAKTAQEVLRFRKKLRGGAKKWFERLPVMRMCLLVEADRYTEHHVRPPFARPDTTWREVGSAVRRARTGGGGDK